MLVRIVPLGNIPAEILQEIGMGIKNTFGANFRIMAKMNMPPEAHNHFRKQYDTDKLMTILSELPEVKFIEPSIPTLVITDQDVFYNGYGFVFAAEYVKEGFLLMSIARLKTDFYGEKPDMSKLRDRTVKEAIHLIGHYVGAEHCPHKECVMAYSPSVKDIDVKSEKFCDKCKHVIKK